MEFKNILINVGSLETSVGIFRRRYCHNGVHAGSIYYAKGVTFGDEENFQGSKLMAVSAGDSSCTSDKSADSVKRDFSITEQDSMATFLGLKHQIETELKRLYVDRHIVSLFSALTSLVTEAHYLKNYSNEPEDKQSDEFKKSIRQTVSLWFASRQ